MLAWVASMNLPLAGGRDRAVLASLVKFCPSSAAAAGGHAVVPGCCSGLSSESCALGVSSECCVLGGRGRSGPDRDVGVVGLRACSACCDELELPVPCTEGRGPLLLLSVLW